MSVLPPISRVRQDAGAGEPAASGAVCGVFTREPARPIAGHPMPVTRGRLAGALEGHLHDRRELAAELGVDQAAHDDLALVMLAYERWKTAAFAKLRGSFALTLVDLASDVAYLLRDPVGHHPFFYTSQNDRVLAATTQRALLDTPGVSRDINRLQLADCLCHRWVDAEETFFSAIRRVPAGAHLRIAGGRVDVVEHWDPHGPLRRRDTDELLSAFDHVLGRAVSRTLSGPEPTGIFLSGGLDSISIAALAADVNRTAGKPLPLALSIGFPDPECDERLIQHSVARRLDLNIELIPFDQAAGARGLLQEVLELNGALDAPLLNYWTPIYLTLARRARMAGIGTILTGSGGDEWLTVSPYLSADLLRAGQWLRLARFVRTRQRSSNRPAWRIGGRMLWQFGARPLIGAQAHRLAPRAWTRNRVKRALDADAPWIAPDAALRRAQRARAEQHLCDAVPAEGFYVREMRQGLRHPLVHLEHEEYFRWGTLTGTRVQHPYWDPDLIALLYATHPYDLDQGGRSKALVRAALARRFPKIGLERQRKVYSADFFGRLVSREGTAVAASLGSLEALGDLGVVDPRKGWDAVRSAFPGSRRVIFPAWELLNYESWVRNHL